MNKDQVKGRVEEAKGKVKEVTGKVLDDKGSSLYRQLRCSAQKLVGSRRSSPLSS